MHHTFSGEKRIVPSFHGTFSGTSCPVCFVRRERGFAVSFILILPEGAGGNSPSPLCLNLPVTSTPQEIVYSANFTGPTETQDLRTLHCLFLLFYLHIKERISFINLSCKIYAYLQTERDKSTSRPCGCWYELTSLVSISSLRLNGAEG